MPTILLVFSSGEEKPCRGTFKWKDGRRRLWSWVLGNRIVTRAGTHQHQGLAEQPWDDGVPLLASVRSLDNVPSETALQFPQKGTYAEYLWGIKPSVKSYLSPEQSGSHYRRCAALCPPLQTPILKKVPTARCLCKPPHRKCEWGLFCYRQHYLKWHKNLLFRKTDHSLKKKKTQRKRNSRMLFPFRNSGLLGNMKRDFYLAN